MLETRSAVFKLMKTNAHEERQVCNMLYIVYSNLYA